MGSLFVGFEISNSMWEKVLEDPICFEPNERLSFSEGDEENAIMFSMDDLCT